MAATAYTRTGILKLVLFRRATVREPMQHCANLQVSSVQARSGKDMQVLKLAEEVRIAGALWHWNFCAKRGTPLSPQ